MKIRLAILLSIFSLPVVAGFNLTSVSNISTAGSNIALVLNHEAFVINPAFLHLSRFAVSNQQLDTTKLHTDKHSLSYIIFNGLGIGTFQKKNSEQDINVTLFGYGASINRNFSWGITYQTISVQTSTALLNSWSSLFGVSYANFRDNFFIGVTLEHFLKENNQALDQIIFPTIGIGLNLIPWEQVMWSHKLSYQRKHNEPIRYSTGISIIANENIIFNFGLHESAYSLGFDIPIQLQPQSYLGSGRFAIEIPYDTAQEIIYSLSYTWGN